MAKSSTRRVTIYINGKEVEASVKQIRAEMNRLINEQNRMVIGSDEYRTCEKSNAHCVAFVWRRERDSNPRRCDPQRFSRPPHSTALPSLQKGAQK